MVDCRVIPLLAIGLVTSALGQRAHITGGITAQYGNGLLPGIEIGDTLRRPYVYREHFLDMTAGYGGFSLWSSLEFSSPPQIGPDHTGLRKLRLSWEGDPVSVSAGDLFGLFGRGLALNMWENQKIDWDSSLRGVWVKARPSDRLSLDFIRGVATGGRHLLQGPGVDPRIRDFSDDATISAVAVVANNLMGGFSICGYVVYVDALNPWFSKIRNSMAGAYDVVDSTVVRTRTVMPGIFGEYLGSNFDAYVEVTRRDNKIEDVDSLYSTSLYKWLHYDREAWGWGGYGSVSYYPGRWGVTVEYKNYLFDHSNPEVRSHLPFRLHRRTPVQNPPSVFKEHSSTLLSRTPHVMDFEDEVGMQIELNYEVMSDLFLVFNYAQSSRHTGFRKIIKPDFTTEWEKQEIPSLFWYTREEKFYPFRELYGEVNVHYRPLNLDFKGMVAMTNEVFSFDELLIEKAELAGHSKEIMHWEKRNLFSLPAQLTLSLPAPAGWGLTLYWEHQWEDLEFRNRIVFRDTTTGFIDSVTTDATRTVPYYYRYVALSLGKPSRFSFGIVYDYTSDLKTGQFENVNPDNDSWLEALIRQAGVDLTNKWFGIQFTGYLTPSTVLSAFYGSLQGGLKCDSGLCTYVPGIEDALTLTLTSNF